MNRNHIWAHRALVSGKFILLAALSRLFAQSQPISPDRPWHSPEGHQVISAVSLFRVIAHRA